MPWSVKKRGDKWAVVKDSTGKVVGTHSSKASANRQVRALYANEPSTKNGKRNTKGR